MFCLKGGQIARSIRKQVKMYKKELKTRSPWVTTTTSQQKKSSYCSHPIPVLFLLFIRSLLIFFVLKKTTQKRPFEWRLKSEWGIKEKEGAAQHHREREACAHAQESRINHFIFAMIIIIIIAMFMTMQRENEKSSIVYDAKGINFSLELHCEPLLWHVINMSTCITIHPSKVITLFASCTMMRCIFWDFSQFFCCCHLVHGEKQYKHVDASCGCVSMLNSWHPGLTRHTSYDINLSFFWYFMTPCKEIASLIWKFQWMLCVAMDTQSKCLFLLLLHLHLIMDFNNS